jgi:hypothetical protein
MRFIAHEGLIFPNYHFWDAVEQDRAGAHGTG